MPKQPTVQEIRSHLREHVVLMGGSDQSYGLEIAGMIRILANAYDSQINHEFDNTSLSGPRIGLLFRLYFEERKGNFSGLTPSQLSWNQNVSRNTISSLLKGLEDQGYIERTLDSTDRRVFLIHLTTTGRDLLNRVGPRSIEYSNRMVQGLSTMDQSMLIELLAKLFTSIQVCSKEQSLTIAGNLHIENQAVTR